jgi:hypothetical protein
MQVSTLRSLAGANATWSLGSGSGSGGIGFGSATANAGIDGNMGNFTLNRCIGNSGNGADNFLAVYSSSSSAWWMLDLGSVVSIANVVVWGRSDCCYSQSSQLTVTVGNSSDPTVANPSCADTVGGFFADPFQGSVVCTGGATTGRYITLSKVGGVTFSFCEVQVYQRV